MAIYDLQKKKSPKAPLQNMLLCLTLNDARRTAERARRLGSSARIFPRAVKAGAASIEVWAVVVREARHA